MHEIVITDAKRYNCLTSNPFFMKPLRFFTRGVFKLYIAQKRISKQAKPSTTKVSQICLKYLDKFSVTLAGDL